MKALLQKFLRKTANTKLFWLYQFGGIPAQWLATPYQYAKRFRPVEDPRTRPCLEEKFPDLTVKNGPFRGLRYARASAAGSALLPKLLGSYEAELAPVLHRILQNDYTEIVDIGSAEGYYAVGLGLRFPRARVFAFDTDPKANELCREMAQLNGMGDRLTTGNFCDEQILLGLPLGDRALIVSDCEGYEKKLFTPQVARFLARHEVLIEVHDLLDNAIGSALRQRFEPTHDLEVIESIDDAKKVRTYDFPELDGCDDATKLFIVSERRYATLQWFYMTPKAPGDGVAKISK